MNNIILILQKRLLLQKMYQVVHLGLVIIHFSNLWMALKIGYSIMPTLQVARDVEMNETLACKNLPGMLMVLLHLDSP